MKKIQNSYKKSGVNISIANKFVNHIAKISKKNVKKTDKSFKTNNIGAFGSAFDISNIKIKDPVIISCTDGVGTKIDLANKFKKFDTIGIDLVAMCVNDILAQGGLPHFFLDYIAVGKLDEKQIKSIIKSIIKGCIIANCALVGGETAEMPGHYVKNNFDIAGFSIGAVERNQILTPSLVKDGDIVIAVESSGIHSNGYSLVRNLINYHSINILKDKFSFNNDENIAETLLKPTTIYSSILKFKPKNLKLHGITHITGGGLIENPIRSFEEDLTLVLDFSTFDISPLFLWIKEKSNLDWYELFKTFNCGIGLLIYVDKKNAQHVVNYINKLKFKAWVIGEMRKKVKKTNSIKIINYEKS